MPRVLNYSDVDYVSQKAQGVDCGIPWFNHAIVYEFSIIMGNSSKSIFQVWRMMIQIWISVTNSCTTIHYYTWITYTHQA